MLKLASIPVIDNDPIIYKFDERKIVNIFSYPLVLLHVLNAHLIETVQHMFCLRKDKIIF